jgi:geranylgeranyl reductase family protein
MERCDAIVVGGGPAGSACARRLKRGGLDVHVLDKRSFPRDKPCAGWITPEVLTLTELDEHDYTQGRVFQPVHGFRIGEIGGPETETRYDHPVSYGIRRCEFDHYLLERCGARLHLGEPVRSITRSGVNWRIDDRFEAPLVVGAGGHFCPVAEMLGAKVRGEGRVVVAQELEFEMTAEQARECRVGADIPELYFCEDLRGYGWCFRKGGHLNVGLGREDKHGLTEHVQNFVTFLHSRERIPRDTPMRLRGHAYTLYGHTQRPRSTDGLILVGDAGGMASSPSGEGIRTAIESGILAAETALAAAGDYSVGCIRNYELNLARRYGPPEPQRDWLTMAPERLKSALGRWLFALPWFTRRVVLERWFLHACPNGPAVNRRLELAAAAR